MRAIPRARSGFTLLEVLLASAIGVLLLGGLYVAVTLQIQQTQAGRDLIEHGTLARALLRRMSSDITSVAAPPIPTTNSQSSSSSATTGTTGSTTGTTGTTSSTGSATGTTGSTTPTASTTTPTQYNIGVQGDASTLALFVTRVPRELLFGEESQNPDQIPIVSDLRRVTYWLAGDGENPMGLARQEIKLVTSDDENAQVPPDIADPGSYVIAGEVQSLTFAYFDGTTWLDTWNGLDVGADGMTPMGPPMAISITIGIRTADTRGERRSLQPIIKTYRRVVAIPTANGLPQTDTSGTTGTTGTTGTGTTTTGTTGQ